MVSQRFIMVQQVVEAMGDGIVLPSGAVSVHLKSLAIIGLMGPPQLV